MKRLMARLRLTDDVKRRWLFVIGGIATGLAAAGFAHLADRAQALFKIMNHNHPEVLWLVTPLGFALCAAMTRVWFPNAQGSGIPQCIAAMRTQSETLRGQLLGMRVALGKILLTLIGLLCGGSIGREGPSVQVGASLMWGLRSRSHKDHEALILAGSAAGIAAAFNAPLAGIVFAIEELSRSFESKTSGLILAATILAGLAATAVSGNYAYFGQTSGTISGWADWGALIVLAATGGLLGGLFSRAVIAVAFNKLVRRLTGVGSHPVLFAAVCGLVVVVCGYFSGGTIYGTGYEEAYGIIHEDLQVAWTFVPFKIIATTVSAVSGIPGGLFSPSLSIGAGLGSLATQILPVSAESATQFALIGMVAYLTGVVQSPITSVVIMAEMTDSHEMVIPLLACALLAQVVSKLVCPVSVYHALAQGFDKKGSVSAA